MSRQFTTDELASRWYDLREIMNLAGKFVTSLLLKQEGTLFDRFWTQGDDACLSFNDGCYVGSAAVRGYYDTIAENTAIISHTLRDLFPQQLGHLSEAELFGVGQLHGLPITTPIIELAEDGQTAKGLWHVHGCDNTLTACGPLSTWSLGFLAIDFRLEQDQWRIWHVLHAEDVAAPMGESWLHPVPRDPKPEFAAVAALKKPPYTVQRQNYIPYAPDRPFTPPPPLPEPYSTFADTFSYGL